MMQFDKLVDATDRRLSTPSTSYSRGNLLIMAGLPGAGKSSVVKQIAAWYDVVVIQTDKIRKQLYSNPTYSNEEVAFIYDICYALIARRLRLRQRVVFDTANYLQAWRQQAITLASAEGATVAICQVQASPAETYNRLLARKQAKESLSDAGWDVYQSMAEKQEPLTDPHLVLDSSSGASVEQMARRLYAYWMEHEH